MLSSLTATEVALLQIALVPAVASVVCGLGAWLVRAERAALVHWAAYAGLGSIDWALRALNLPSRPLPAVLIGVCSAISLRHGIRLQPDGI